jgi:predicted ribosomally synthesized peptide with nif11-like leader
MSQSEVERFVQAVKADPKLRAEIEGNGRPDALVAIAGARGYGFTRDELAAHTVARARAAGRELSAGELDGITGGSGSIGYCLNQQLCLTPSMRGGH